MKRSLAATDTKKRLKTALCGSICSIVTAAIIIPVTLFACNRSNATTGTNLMSIIDTAHRYRFIESPSEYDILSEINTYNNWQFEIGELKLTTSITDESVDILPISDKYSGEAVIHYDLTPDIYLSDLVTVLNIGRFAEEPNIDDVMTYTINANFDTYPDQDMWDSFMRNCTSRLFTSIKYAQIFGIDNQTTGRPFVGSVMVYWTT